VRLIVNYEENLLRALADTVGSSNTILEAYTSNPFIKMMKVIQPPGLKWMANLLLLKLGYPCHILTPRVKSQETNMFFLSHDDYRSESLRTHHMIIFQGISSWRITNNDELH
jgi:hypothetical protein